MKPEGSSSCLQRPATCSYTATLIQSILSHPIYLRSNAVLSFLHSLNREKGGSKVRRNFGTYLSINKVAYVRKLEILNFYYVSQRHAILNCCRQNNVAIRRKIFTYVRDIHLILKERIPVRIIWCIKSC